MLNVKLLRKIKKHILEEPRRLVMWAVQLNKSDGSPKFIPDGPTIKETVPFAKCGTAACIAGWACILSKEEVGLTRAEQLLGIDDDQSRSLFNAERWPSADAYSRAKTQRQRANLAAKRIDQFIAEHTSQV